MRNNKLYLTQLSAENQKHIRRCIEMVTGFLHQAESRLRGYESEDAEAATCFVIKTIVDLGQTIAITEGMLGELVKAHGLPDNLTLVRQFGILSVVAMYTSPTRRRLFCGGQSKHNHVD